MPRRLPEDRQLAELRRQLAALDAAIADFERIARLHSLASDFLTLQGFHQVVLGIILLLVVAALEVNSAWDIWLFPAALVLTGIASWRIHIYYERRFGYVELRTRPGFWGSGQSFLRRGLFWIPAVLLSVALEKMANISLSGYFLGLLFVGSFVTENRPRYYLLFSLPFFVIAGVGRFLHDPFSLLWVEVWLPVALIITGVLDHLRLVRSFPGVRSNGDAERGLRFPDIDRVIHEPTRLAILTVLGGCGAADFLFLENATGLSRGNLSVQLTKREDAGLIKIRKEIVGKKTRTTASLTAKGTRDMAQEMRS